MYDEAFPKRLKKARKKTGFTQAEVAKELNIKPNSISMYETGKREPDLQTLAHFAEFYGTSVDWLLGNDNTRRLQQIYKWDELKIRATDFPRKLKIARTQRGITQEYVARLLSIPRSSIAKYELGQQQPSIEKLTKLVLYYQVKADWLLGLVE